MKTKYRPEVDGLRAIAVISVIFYHAKFQLGKNFNNIEIFQGGYFGVDIFFVISGYLITKYIYNEIKDKTLSIPHFYERRARRLLPALLVVIAFSILGAWIFMMPNQMKAFSGSAISSLFFFSNFWFLSEDSYLADVSALKPLLHTWSLSVEEQYYLIFPIFFLFLIFKAFKKSNIIIFSLIIISFLFSIFTSNKNPELNFYLIFSRVWEILSGVLIAKVEVEKSINLKKRAKLFPFIGIVLILFSLFFFDDSIKHPGVITILPIAGTILILSSSNSSEGVGHFLANKIMVGTGLISYSLYLWHFPIFAFARIKSDLLSNYDKFEFILITILFSIITYFLIEKPFRNFKIIKTKVFLIVLGFCFFVLVSINSWIYFSNGLPKRYSDQVLKFISFNYDYNKIYQEGKCYIKINNLQKDNVFKKCKIEKFDENKKNLYLWGDSHAAHLYPGILNKFRKKYNIFHRSAATCKPFLYHEKHKCNKINSNIINDILKNKPNKIYLVGAWTQNKLNEDKEIKNIEKTLIFLSKNLKESEINLVGPSIIWSDPLPKILLKKYRLSRKIPNYLNDDKHKQRLELDKKFIMLTKNINIKYHSPMRIFCKKGKCLTKVGEDPDSLVTWDENHYTEKSSIYLVEKF